MTEALDERVRALEQQVAELALELSGRALRTGQPGGSADSALADPDSAVPDSAVADARSRVGEPTVEEPTVGEPAVGDEPVAPPPGTPSWAPPIGPPPPWAAPPTEPGSAAATGAEAEAWTPPSYPRAPLTAVNRRWQRRRESWDLLRLLGERRLRERLPLDRTPGGRSLGGRLLALVGGVAVVIGIAFFVGLAVNRGWVGPQARLALAGSASAALLGVGYWLYERRGRLQAALAVVGTAVAGLYLTLTAATAGYHLVPAVAALPAAVGVGVLATAIAVRWDTRTVAGLGIGGALAAPLLADALSTSGLAFLAVAGAAATTVLIWRCWQWLAVGASALMLVEVTWWSMDEPAGAALVVVLAGFALLNLALGLGHELREPTSAVQPAAALLVPFGVLVLGVAGYVALPHGPGQRAGALWLLGLAALHGALAVAARWTGRVSVEVQVALLGAAVVLTDVAAGLLGHGWSLALGWTASALGLAVLSRRATRRAVLVQLTLGVQLALAVGHLLVIDARPDRLVTGEPIASGAAAAVVAVMVTAFASGRLVPQAGARWRIVLDGLSISGLAYVTALALDGAALLVVWAVSAVALARTADRWADRVARLGAAGLLVCLAGHVLWLDAPPTALVEGLRSVPLAVLGLALVAAVALALDRLQDLPAGQVLLLRSTAAVSVLYLGSTLIVDLAGAGLGQTLLSVCWAVCGTASLIVGVRRYAPALRLGGLTLLAVAATKVFGYDLGALHDAYRVGSFLGLGLVLLGAGYAYQRLLDVR